MSRPDVPLEDGLHRVAGRIPKRVRIGLRFLLGRTLPQQTLPEGASSASFVLDRARSASSGAGIGNSAHLPSSGRGCRRTITTATSWSNSRGALHEAESA